jgi:hypothetical protein
MIDLSHFLAEARPPQGVTSLLPCLGRGASSDRGLKELYHSGGDGQGPVVHTPVVHVARRSPYPAVGDFPKGPKGVTSSASSGGRPAGGGR